MRQDKIKMIIKKSGYYRVSEWNEDTALYNLGWFLECDVGKFIEEWKEWVDLPDQNFVRSNGTFLTKNDDLICIMYQFQEICEGKDLLYMSKQNFVEILDLWLEALNENYAEIVITKEEDGKISLVGNKEQTLPVILYQKLYIPRWNVIKISINDGDKELKAIIFRYLKKQLLDLGDVEDKTLNFFTPDGTYLYGIKRNDSYKVKDIVDQFPEISWHYKEYPYASKNGLIAEEAKWAQQEDLEETFIDCRIIAIEIYYQ